MASRLKLHEELCSLLDNVYFQPPESLKIKYPCVVYKLSTITSRYANNNNYTDEKRYEVILITKDPDDELIKDIYDHFQYCSVNRTFINDNLYHYAYFIYY